MNKFRLQVVSILLMAIFCIGQCPLFAQEKIIAIVNDDAITQRDLDDFISFTRVQLSSQYGPEEVESRINALKPELLNKLIDDRVILQEAKKNKIKADENKVNARIDGIRARYGSDGEFQAALKRQGIVLADIQSRVREQIMTILIVDSKVRSKVTVSPNEVTTFYKDHQPEFRVPEQRELDTFATEDADKALRVVSGLRSGSDKDKIASDESAEKDQMAVKRGQLRQDIEDAVFALKTGEVSEPFKIDEKYYIFRLQRIIPAMIKSLPQVHDKIYASLFNQKAEEQMTAWLNGLKKNSYIKIFQN